MNLTFPCSQCSEPISFTPSPGAEWKCKCGATGKVSPASYREGQLVACPVCGTEDMYLQKDFPQGVGVAIATLGAILATVAWAYYQWFLTFGILFGFGALDCVLYFTRGNVLICYRCLAQLRGLDKESRFEPFDHGVNERYRQERIRKEAGG